MSPSVHAAIIVVGVVVMALPAQLRYHFRRPEPTSTDEVDVIAESEEQISHKPVSEHRRDQRP